MRKQVRDGREHGDGPESGFSQDEKDAVYRVLQERRDVRSGYLPRPLEDATLCRLLSAAHSAPSVGLMQPWRFIVVRDEARRARCYGIFQRANRAAAAEYAQERGQLYGRLRLEGSPEAPQHLCVVCEATSTQGHGLGRRSMRRHRPIPSSGCTESVARGTG